MDKNFIRIDDLVRQHLEGAEENERAGAWLNMRELLDKEMPQKKRIAVFYWRRLFGLVAAASLLGTVAVGGYELTSAYRGSGTNADFMAINANNGVSHEHGSTVGANGIVTGMEEEPATAGNITIRRNVDMHKDAEESGAADAGMIADASDDVSAGNASAAGNAISSHNAATVQDAAGVKMAHTVTAGNTSDNSHVNPGAAAGNNVTTHDRVRANNDVAAVQNTSGKALHTTTSQKTQQRNVATYGSNAVKASGKEMGGGVTAHRPAAIAAKGTTVPDKPVTDMDNRPHAARDGKNGSSGHSAARTITGQTAATATNKTANTTGNKTAAHAADGAFTADGAEVGIAARRRKDGINAGSSKAEKTTASAEKNNKGTASAGITTTGSAIAKQEPVNTSPAKDEALSVLNASGPVTMNANGAGAAVAHEVATSVKENKGEDAGRTAGTTAAEKAVGNAPVTSGNVAGKDVINAVAGASVKESAVDNRAATVNETSVPSASGTGSHTGGHTATVNTRKTNDTHNTNAAKTSVVGTSSAHTAGGAKVENTAGADGEDGNAPGKRVVTRMVVREREVKTGDNEFMTKVDTISMEKMNRGGNGEEEAEEDTEETAVAAKTAAKGAGSNTAVAGEPAATGMEGSGSGSVTAKRRRGRRHNAADESPAALSAGTSAGNAAEETAMASESASPAATVAASEESASGTPAAAEEAKTNKKTKARSGVSLLQKLSAAFNDVKQNAAGAHLMGGLTAGINNNFFGPSNMRGFQFGLFGTLVLNDSWNMMAELKYFNRVNNNTIDDNYYSYTNVGTQYRRNLVLNTYDFAALHTLEMPVSIRYTKGNFNFYAGGNFMYSFSINTAPTTITDPNTPPTYVNTPGTDNTPQYNKDDFRSRFGLGYLFGFSYQVGRNTSLDLRSVQTVWDNAASTGARSISGQLMRTPSLQLSVMYRLGGNRNKE